MDRYHEMSALFEGNKSGIKKAVKDERARRDAERIRQRIDNATALFWMGIGSIVCVGTLYAILLAVI